MSRMSAMMKRHSYNLYGLCVRSDWLLQCPESGEDVPHEIELVEAAAPLMDPRDLPDPTDATSQCVAMNDGAFYIRWPGLMEFLVSANGRKILGYSLNADCRETLQAFFFGRVLSFALLKLGIEQLHATAVVIHDRAVGFMGDAGYGKSTLAAAFVQKGYPLLTDDLLVIYQKGTSFFARPGLPRLKLFADSAKAVCSDVLGPETAVNRVSGKQVTRLSATRFYEADAPIQVLYLLDPAPAETKVITIDELRQHKAFVEICKAAFNGEITEGKRLKEHFLMASRLASSVPVKRLSVPRSLAALPSVCDAVLADMAIQRVHA